MQTHNRTLRYFTVALIAAFSLAPLSAVTADEVVQVPSLQVKERLASMQQITVSAEKPAQQVEAESAAVEALLKEADALDRADEAEPAED